MFLFCCNILRVILAEVEARHNSSQIEKNSNRASNYKNLYPQVYSIFRAIVECKIERTVNSAPIMVANQNADTTNCEGESSSLLQDSTCRLSEKIRQTQLRKP